MRNLFFEQHPDNCPDVSFFDYPLLQIRNYILENLLRNFPNFTPDRRFQSLDISHRKIWTVRGQRNSVFLKITRFGNFSFSRFETSVVICETIPSCWNHILDRDIRLRCKEGIKNSYLGNGYCPNPTL